MKCQRKFLRQKEYLKRIGIYTKHYGTPENVNTWVNTAYFLFLNLSKNTRVHCELT